MLVVTSVYKDSYQNVYNFTLKHNIHLLVYNKNDAIKIGEEKTTFIGDKLTIIDIPNFGRCDYAFLYFIITNYNKLPEKVLFTKANFMDQGIQLHHAFNTESFMLIGKHVKFGILNKDFDTSLLIKSGVHERDLERLYYNKTNNPEPDTSFVSYITNDFYNIVYENKPFPDDYVINMGHGPCFCVTKEYILGHSIDIYEKLLDTFFPNKGHWTKWEGHTEEDTYYHVGKRYHDNLTRFWMLLFVQDYKNKNIETDLQNYIKIRIK